MTAAAILLKVPTIQDHQELEDLKLQSMGSRRKSGLPVPASLELPASPE